ncbi:hypothetical protein BGZ63DRAFT_398742 [Mariannaea sp. PMI_226]|nr:hypothetical protein BGZ63DRAFT_398742 [Mariannaea sp. PMI_226]
MSLDNSHPPTYTPNVLLIGVGPFAKRIYIPRLKALEASGRAKLVAAVDVFGNEASLRIYGHDSCPTVEWLFVPLFTRVMPPSVCKSLNGIIKRHQVSCVIISTEPLAHCAYGVWALEAGLNIVMDKPVSTRVGAVKCLEEGRGIAEDFQTLLQKYKALQIHRETCCIINSHRRFHLGFSKTAEIIQDVQDKTGCPVTSIRSVHCDGQWRLPSEIIHQEYHTYNQGYGKVSHSGYHTIDAVYQFLKAGMGPTKAPDRVEVNASCLQPRGFLFQLNEQDYERVFGAKAYKAAAAFSQKELYEKTKDYGEMDAAVQMTFYHGQDAVALVNLDLQHIGFGRRAWLQPGQDLYKGNGRVRHETHEIKSGPFQTVIVNSRQSGDKHDNAAKGDAATEDSKLGSQGHFDIELFQNCEMLGTTKALQVLPLQDLVGSQLDLKHGYSHAVKHAALDEMITFMEGKKSLHNVRSNLPDHSVTTHIMSAIYMSLARRNRGLDSTISLDVAFQKGTGSAQFSDDRAKKDGKCCIVIAL